MMKEPNTLINRFFGLFHVEKEFISHTFVVIENIIPPLPGLKVCKIIFCSYNTNID